MLTHNVFSVGKSASYSEPYQTCKMKRFAKIFDDLNPLNISAKHFISEHDEKVLPCHDVILSWRHHDSSTLPWHLGKALFLFFSKIMFVFWGSGSSDYRTIVQFHQVIFELIYFILNW